MNTLIAVLIIHPVIMIYGRQNMNLSTVLNTTALNQHTCSSRSKISYTKLKFKIYGRIHNLIRLLLGAKEKINWIQNFTVHCQLYVLSPSFSHFRIIQEQNVMMLDDRSMMGISTRQTESQACLSHSLLSTSCISFLRITPHLQQSFTLQLQHISYC